MKRYAVMWSGGKDSALALRRALSRGLEIGALLNIIDSVSERVRFHATRRELIVAQAAALGLPLRQIGTAWEEFEPAFRDALAALVHDGFAGVVFGDIHLADVRAWYETRVRAAGLDHIEPLWSEPPATLVADFVDQGGRAVITCVELARLDRGWLGRRIEPGFAEAIAATGIDPAGENGEYHSFAFDGPPYRTPVAWLSGATRQDRGFLQLDLLDPASLAAEVAAEHTTLFADAVAAKPKAWGAFAAQGVLAYRRQTGRAPDEGERRAIWGALWRRIESARAAS